MAYEFGNYRVVHKNWEPDALEHWGDFTHAIQHRPLVTWNTVAATFLLSDAITAAKALRDKEREKQEEEERLAAELGEDAE